MRTYPTGRFWGSVFFYVSHKEVKFFFICYSNSCHAFAIGLAALGELTCDAAALVTLSVCFSKSMIASRTFRVFKRTAISYIGTQPFLTKSFPSKMGLQVTIVFQTPISESRQTMYLHVCLRTVNTGSGKVVLTPGHMALSGPHL